MGNDTRTITIRRGNTERSCRVASLEETEHVAREFAGTLMGGDVVALSGELGAGKTTFTQAVARAFRVSDPVTSPTFIIMNVFGISPVARGIATLCHVDAYRLEKGEELLNVGIEDYMGNPSVVTLIEWPERVAEILPESTLWVEITGTRGDSGFKI